MKITCPSFAGDMYAILRKYFIFAGDFNRQTFIMQFMFVYKLTHFWYIFSIYAHKNVLPVNITAT